MIKTYKLAGNDLTAYIESMGYAEFKKKHDVIYAQPKPYMELVEMFGLTGDNFIDTPWTTIPEMQRVLVTRNTVLLSIPRSKSSIRFRDKTQYLVSCGGWSYPSGAFEIIDQSSTKLNKNLEELKI